MYAVKNAASVHTRINKTILRATDIYAVKVGLTRSQVLNSALAAYLYPVIAVKVKTKAKTKARKARR